jgi:potassium efflux system protein
LLLLCKKRNKLTGNLPRVWQTIKPLVLFLAIITSAHVFANGADSSIDLDAAQSPVKLIEFLAQEKVNLTIANNQIKQTMPAVDQNALDLQKKQNQAMSALVQAKIYNLRDFLVNQKKQNHDLSVELKKLQQAPLDKSEEYAVEEKASQLSNFIDVNEKAIELINENLLLAREYLGSLSFQKKALDLLQAKFNEGRELELINHRIDALEDTKKNLYQKNIELQQNKKSTQSLSNSVNYEAKMLFNNQLIVLIDYKINELQLKQKVLQADLELLSNTDVKTLQIVISTYKNVLNQLQNIQRSLQEMLKIVSQEVRMVNPSSQILFTNLEKNITSRIKENNGEQDRIAIMIARVQGQLKEMLGSRQSLISYQNESISSITWKLLSIPVHFYQYGKVLLYKAKENYFWQDTWPKGFFWGVLAAIGALAFSLFHLLRHVIQDKERSLLTAHLYDGFLVLLYRNLPHLALLASLVAIFYLNHIPYTNYQLLVNLILVWLTFRNLLLVARMMLLERLTDVSGEDVKFYYRLKWLLLLGGWSTGLLVFSHQLPLPILLQDIFNRLFMFFLLMFSIVAFRSREVIPYLLEPVLNSNKRYVYNAVRILNVLIPITLLTTAVIGLIGYFNLAWSLGLYQIYVLSVITGYVLLRGLVFDALELLSVWMISTLQNGWLWIEVFLKPLDNLMRLALIFCGVSLLFQLFGWYADSWVVAKIIEIGKYPFINLSGIRITLFSACEFILLLFFLAWLAKWTREFCYRWVYRTAKDAGIRNSLSVFTQYAIILLGGFITLRVLGLDFSGMSMILGGLAVGMGFGLRDFASNIVGGLMLLIERPVREGDLITLGEYEGKVAHIGIRSMRVSSWDNTEVLIPNAETFSKPFTNWTHQDNVVRTVVPFKVSRKDDPIIIQQITMDVLAIIPEILMDPPPEVLLKSIEEALIEFEIRYFINIEVHTRFQVRSKVLFSMLEQFKAAGISEPIQPLHIELKDSGSEYMESRKPTKQRT